MQPAEQPTPAPRRRSVGSRALRWLVVLALVAVAGFAAYTWAMLRFSFSSGERVGYVQKFSRRGWICKTWEGELAMVNMPGTMSEKFPFTVRDDAIAADLNRIIGKRVALSYEQHVGLPTTCFGDTEYFVTKVTAAE